MANFSLPDETVRGLRDEHHVRHEGKSFQLQLRDVRLEQDVHLGRGFVDRFLDGDRHSLHKLVQFKLLLFTNADVTEFSGQGKYSEQFNLAQVGFQQLNKNEKNDKKEANNDLGMSIKGLTGLAN